MRYRKRISICLKRIRQGGYRVGRSPSGKAAVILQTQLDKQVNQAVRHTNDLLYRLLGIIVVDQKAEFFHN